MRRRVGMGISEDEDDDVFRGLSMLGTTQEGIQGEDLTGAAQDQPFLNEIPRFGDVRENEYLANMRRISQLPLAMSKDEDIRGDALENLGAMESQADTPGWLRSLEQSAQTPNRFARESMMRQASGEDQGEPGWIRSLMNMASTPGAFAQESMQRLPREEATITEEAPEEEARPSFRDIFKVPAIGTENMKKAAAENLEKGGPNFREALKVPGIGTENMKKAFAERQQKKIIPQQEAITPEMVEQEQAAPMAPEAMQQAFSNEVIDQDLKRLNDMQELPPEAKERAELWNGLIQKERDELTEEEQNLLQQAADGSLSTGDKIALGIAIAVPILVALRFGGEAGLVALGAGLQGVGGALGEKAQNQSKAQAGLKSNAEERRKLEEKNIDVQKKIADQEPNKEVRDFLKNKKIAKIGDKAAIGLGDEKGVLWLDGSQFEDSAEGVKKARKDIEEVQPVIKLANKATSQISKGMDLLDSMDASMWDAVRSKSGRQFKVKMVDKEGKTKEVDAFPLLTQTFEVLQDIYNKMNLETRASLPKTVVNHWGAILGDPTDFKAWLKGYDLQTFRDRLESLQDSLNMGMKEDLVSRGFLREPLDSSYPSGNWQPLESESSVIKKMREGKK